MGPEPTLAQFPEGEKFVSKPFVQIYADESCLGNQFKNRNRPGGAGGIVEYRHPERGLVRRDFWLSEPDTTNNRMAIRSALLPLSFLKRESDVEFTSDSRYLVDGMSKWVANWERRGWTRKGGPIENLELWQELVPVARRHRVAWKWVKGHAGHPQNEYANDLAIRAAGEQVASDGLVASRFDQWILEQQDKGKYLEFNPFV